MVCISLTEYSSNMTLKDKIKPLIFFMGFVLAFSFVLPVFAYPNNVQEYDTSIHYDTGTGVFSLSYVIPASVISTSDCNYYATNGQSYFYVQIFNSNDTELMSKPYPTGPYNSQEGGFLYSDIVSQGSFNYSMFYSEGILIGSIPLTEEYTGVGEYYVLVSPRYPLTEYSSCGTAYGYFKYSVDAENNILEGISPSIDGTCGTADGTIPTTFPITGTDACAKGTLNNMHDYYTPNGWIYSWACLGSGQGISVACETLPIGTAINGTCGLANGMTVNDEPTELEKCDVGYTNNSTLKTLTGWTWTCHGFYNGTNENCSATYGNNETPPVIPDLNDCGTYTGIDAIICNIGNTIQGIFLPSASKITELQTTLNGVANVFPFSYLSVISSIFSNAGNITENSLTLTIMGNTETINPSYFDIPIFAEIKNGFTILIILGLIVWAIGYIKHFFK